MNEDRYINRRKMAWRSFWLFSTLSVCVVTFGLWSDVNAQRVSSLGVLIGTIIAPWISIILAYYGVTVVTDRAEISKRKSVMELETALPVELQHEDK